MKHDAAMTARPQLGEANGWPLHLRVTGAAVIVLLALMWRDTADIATIWWTSSTYEHCLLIPPIIAWLIWQRSGELSCMAPTAWPAGLAIVALGALFWGVGHAAGVGFARHLGLAVMIQGIVAACLGRAVARGLLFPLGYLLFLVPFGDSLVPPLQTLTARLSMAMLALTGVPAHIEGVFIAIPAGNFEVAEACSGVKFLVAMAAYGALVANICFRSPWRRTAFMAVALVVPILANGVRAWGTMFVASRSGVDFAAGFDHVVYGWVFFAVVIAAIVLGAWPFFDRPRGSRPIIAEQLQPPGTRPGARNRLLGVSLAALAIAITPAAWTAILAAQGRHDVPQRIALPDLRGWVRLPAEGGTRWRPRFDGADATVMARYVDGIGDVVDLYVAVLAHQGEGHELVGYGHGAVDPDSDWAWVDDRVAPPDGRAIRIQTAGPGSTPVVREVVTFYRVGQITTGSEPRVKLETLKVHLLGGPQRAVAILVSAEQPAEGNARPAIDRFLRQLGPIGPFADRAAGLAPTR
jgi:exosortase A